MDDNEVKSDGPVKWSWWDVILVLVALFGLMLGARFLRDPLREFIALFELSGDALRTVSLFAGTFLQALIMVGAVVLLTGRKGATGKDLGLTAFNARENIKTGLSGGLVLAFFIWIVGITISLLLGPPPPQEIEVLLTGLKGKHLLLPFLTVSVLAPLSEELYFRGMVYPVIKARFGAMTGMVLSGLFFGALHLDLYRIIPIGVGGMVLAYFYEKTGSLVTPIIAHSVWNTIMLIMLYLAGQYLPQG